jgi:hypothetical protein
VERPSPPRPPVVDDPNAGAAPTERTSLWMMKTSLAPSPPLLPFGEEAEPFAPGEPVLEIVWF